MRTNHFAGALSAVVLQLLCLGACSSSPGGGAGTGGAGTGGAGTGAAGTGAAGTDAGAAGTGAAGTAAAGTGAAGTSLTGTTETRLVPWQVEPEGTAPLVLGIYDRQEKALCRFLPDEAGQLRCLPWVTTPFTGTSFTSMSYGLMPVAETGVYTDAACSKPLYQIESAVASRVTGRRMALPLPRLACAPKRYAVGTLKPAETTGPVYGGTPCAPLQTRPNSGSMLVDLTTDTVESPEGWMKGMEVSGPLLWQGRVSVRRIQSADGARFDDRLVDLHWNRPCRVAADLDNVYCQPPTLFESAGVEGTQCMGKRIWSKGPCDEAVALRGGGGGGTPFAVGPLWTGPVSFNGGHGGCRLINPRDTPDGPTVFVQEGPLLADAYVPPRPWKVGGTGRFQLRGPSDDAGDMVPLAAWLLFRAIDTVVVNGNTARFRDTVAQKDCNPIRTPEGVLRCVPTGALIALGPDQLFEIGFSDAQCTKKAYYCQGPCTGPVIRAVADANELRASSIEAAEKPKAIYSLDADQSCSRISDGQFAISLGGPPMSWDQFPMLPERNAPPPEAR